MKKCCRYSFRHVPMHQRMSASGYQKITTISILTKNGQLVSTIKKIYKKCIVKMQNRVNDSTTCHPFNSRNLKLLDGERTLSKCVDHL